MAGVPVREQRLPGGERLPPVGARVADHELEVEPLRLEEALGVGDRAERVHAGRGTVGQAGEPRLRKRASPEEAGAQDR